MPQSTIAVQVLCDSELCIKCEQRCLAEGRPYFVNVRVVIGIAATVTIGIVLHRLRPRRSRPVSRILGSACKIGTVNLSQTNSTLPDSLHHGFRSHRQAVLV